ncbi:thaumatin-like protein 1b isoform X4 [Rhododendron vialii]|uniref:thaumatin-like protein 1b isoform X4 n=1 Tax=Rhododendron vialii TaxID=182163 RepID=UPI00266049C6|nr:thaumatin-like protein 1b isoform X4 [Rhododendron vialii]
MAQFRLLFSLLSLTLPPLFISGVFSSRTFTLQNNCDHPVWPVIFDTGISQLSTTGFVLQTGQSKIINAPSQWNGRFWGRTGCAQNQSTGEFSCVTGDCGTGKLECSGNSGQPPATLVEFSINVSSGLDFYDVSLVDGYNLPILVVPQGGTGDDCKTTGCMVDLNGLCPWDLSVTESEGNGIVACQSPCVRFNKPEYCCTGEYATPNTCKPTLYSESLKRACPLAYSYPYDDETSTFTCASGADYLITFCPSPSTSGGSSSTFKAELFCTLDETF